MCAVSATGASGATDLVLAGFRLRLAAEHPGLLGPAIAAMVPPCGTETARDLEPDWTLQVDQADSSRDQGAVFEDRPVLVFPHGGPRLAVAGVADRMVRVLGRYRPDSAVVSIDVDPARRMTRVVVPRDAGVCQRWVDWLARVFFGSRMLTVGWRMLHASAVAVDGAAVLFLAGQCGGKSTLAHRACMELGAGFLADDLVLVGPDRRVVGWPTRIALPAELVGTTLTGDADHHSVVAGVPRRRVVLNPLEHRVMLKVTHSPPVPLGAVVRVQPAPRDGHRPTWATGLDEAALDRAVSRAAAVPAQQLHVSDVLGLMGGPRLADPGGEESDLSGLLGGVPAATLWVGDMASLSRIAVWEALSSVVPQIVGADT